MADVFDFDEESVRKIARTVHRLQAQVQNLEDMVTRLTKSRPRLPRAWVMELNETLAATQGTISSNPTVQTADAKLVRKNFSSPRALEYYEPVGATNVLEVCNAFNEEIASGERIIALEDVYGTLWAVLTGTMAAGGGTEIIEFKILSVSDWTATVFITSRPCGNEEVTGESGGTLTVNDASHCFLDEPDADLVGRAGWAAYMDPGPVESATGTGTGTGTDLGCEWRIFSLCCPTC